MLTTPPNLWTRRYDNGSVLMVVCFVALGISLLLLRPKLHPHVPVPTPTKPTNKSLNPAALEAVLQDLLTHKGKDAFIEPRKTLLFAPDALLNSRWLGDILNTNKNTKAWNNLTQTQKKAFYEAARHLRERVKVKDGFQKFVPANEKIKIFPERKPSLGTNEEPQESVFLDEFNRPVRAFPPGYSKDGQYAVVRMAVPWSVHSADVTYLLAKRDGRWIVVVRQFAYYF